MEEEHIIWSMEIDLKENISTTLDTVKALITLIFKRKEKDLAGISNNLLTIIDMNRDMNLDMKTDMIQDTKEVYHYKDSPNKDKFNFTMKVYYNDIIIYKNYLSKSNG